MTHDHSQPACPACKKVINNYVFIANLAPLIDGPEAAALATAARAFGAIAVTLGIKVDTEGFTGCEQGRLLLGWIRSSESPDADLMNAWTAEIWDVVADLAAGKMQ